MSKQAEFYARRLSGSATGPHTRGMRWLPDPHPCWFTASGADTPDPAPPALSRCRRRPRPLP